MTLKKQKLLVLYGSQTGTAHDVADRIVREAKRRHFSALAVDMDTYQVHNLINEKLVVFVCSTTGQGDPPDNMRLFWKFLLRKDLPSTSLNQLQFAVLGLGDSSYLKYNVVGKRLQKRIEQLGGHPFHSLGLADDQHDLGVDAVVTPWLSSLWDTLIKMFPLPAGLDVIPSDICPPPKYKVKFIESSVAASRATTDSTHMSHTEEGHQSSDKKVGPLCPFHARLISNSRITAPDHFQDVRLIKLDIRGSNISYVPGDVMMVKPQNLPSTVDSMLAVLGQDPDRVFVLQQNDPDVALPPCFPEPCSVKWLLTNYLDFNSVPRRSFFELLKYHTQDELEKEKLEEFCSPQGQEELYSYCNRVKRTILEVLQDFSKTSASVPFEYLFDIIPPLQPRAFSIASSPKAHRDELHILMAVVRYQTKLHLPRRGVCSTWLSSLDPADDVTVPVWVKPGTIRFPSDVDVPVIMVGPGTGLAPFRSLIHDRCGQSLGSLTLFFGCRSRSKDFYCIDEFKDTKILQVFTAFSRDQANKVYAQHIMAQQGEMIWSLINDKRAAFFIAGNAKSMPDDVKDTLCDIISQHGGMSRDQSVLYLQDLERKKRFQVEAWS
ncbi:NADPH-dependent diflavin oxidoreductase 1-like [Physella acuta]|uniref:NADPH-dependent diflavin oxidoreductase 1-like n=1 Tax=Physella acuta TaxID=109671 RepID=UPI0027DC4BED|nr:NADPH-dependent diflavin oxidoreductase 1-like [Physella acuta]XP_059146404.1 NADPH-dependent diflavin oxidoreductase 1-like [Physella acuta]